MTISRYTGLLAGLALLGSGLASAQHATTPGGTSGKVFARYTKPLRTVALDLATGTVTRGPVTGSRTGQTIDDFNNIDLGGFVGVDTGNCFCEWFDAGVKGFRGNNSDMMNDIVFAYCGALLDPASGGPGGSVKLGFYEGYVLGGGAPTTAVAVFTLTGLPANTASSSFFGGFTCYFIQVTFGTMVCFADGNIGYSWKFLDLGLDGTLAGTWPFLSCVQSCTGSSSTFPDGQGMTDFIDEYCPPGTLRATFTFGTTVYGKYFTSMSMAVDEALDDTATTGVFIGDGVNADTITPLPVIAGSTWSAPMTIGHTHGASGPLALKVRAGTVNGPNFPSPLGGRTTEVLVGGPFLITVTGSHNGVTGNITPVNIPKRLSLLCAPWAAQYTVVGGGFGDLSRAATGTTGTQ
jgi:hypothetical protein